MVIFSVMESCKWHARNFAKVLRHSWTSQHLQVAGTKLLGESIESIVMSSVLRIAFTLMTEWSLKTQFLAKGDRDESCQGLIP